MFLGGRFECGCAVHTSFVVCGGIKASETKSMLFTSYIIGLYIFWGQMETQVHKMGGDILRQFRPNFK